MPAESWGTFVGYCVPQLITVCVLYTEIKISTLFEYMMRFIRKLNLALLLGHPVELADKDTVSIFRVLVTSVSDTEAVSCSGSSLFINEIKRFFSLFNCSLFLFNHFVPTLNDLLYR